MAKQYQSHKNGTNASDFTLSADFRGYFEKRDITTLPPGCLVKGSQNIISKTDGTFGNRPGYTLLGAADATIAPIVSSYDWVTTKGYDRHVRSGNNKLQFLYNDDWVTLVSGLSSTTQKYNYATLFLFGGEDLRAMIFVNGTSNIYEWGGGIAEVASNTATTLTKSGTSTWAEEGFYTSTSGRAVTVNGVSYTYTGGETTTTLTGLTALPTFTAGDVAAQSVLTTANSAMTAPTGYSAFSTFENTNIHVTPNNQVLLSAENSSLVFLSQTNTYKDYSFANPRAPGEGGLAVTHGNNPIFVSQEDTTYVSSGKDAWYQVSFEDFVTANSATGEAYQVFTLKPIQSSLTQGALNQSSIFKAKNKVFLLTNEVTMDELGRVINNFITPQFTNYSDPVKDLFDRLDFTDASGIYHRYNIYIAVPRESLVLIYNMSEGFWESPQILPISSFSIINNTIYGHSNAVPETYKLFDGYSDNGNPIDAKAYFSYQNFGTRSMTKYFTQYYTEGYISPNTELVIGFNLDTDGCQSTREYTLSGSDDQFVCVTNADASLGKVSLGKSPLGGSLVEYENRPKFRRIDTGQRQDFYEMQAFYRSNGVDYDWKILAFGPGVIRTNYSNNAITT